MQGRAVTSELKAGILIIQLLSGTQPTGSLIRIPEIVKNPTLSATCREGIVLLQAHQNSIRFQPEEVPKVAGVILQDLAAVLHIAEDLLQDQDPEVHILQDLFLQVHQVADLHPLLILPEEEDKKIEICFF